MHKDYKVEAIRLRKQGKTYSEIRKVIPVSKSTLTLWFLDVKLAQKQQQRITAKRKEAQQKGADAQRAKRLRSTQDIFTKGLADIGSLSARELKLVGTALYWAEGSKQKEYHPSVGIRFANSDSQMLKFFILWIEKVLKVKRNLLTYEIYIHNTHKHRVQELKNYWSEVFKVEPDLLRGVYFKKGNIKTKRKNIGDLYYGVVRIKVPRSTVQNRIISGWVNAICCAKLVS